MMPHLDDMRALLRPYGCDDLAERLCARPLPMPLSTAREICNHATDAREALMESRSYTKADGDQVPTRGRPAEPTASPAPQPSADGNFGWDAAFAKVAAENAEATRAGEQPTDQGSWSDALQNAAS